VYRGCPHLAALGDEVLEELREQAQAVALSTSAHSPSTGMRERTDRMRFLMKSSGHSSSSSWPTTRGRSRVHLLHVPVIVKVGIGKEGSISGMCRNNITVAFNATVTYPRGSVGRVQPSAHTMLRIQYTSAGKGGAWEEGITYPSM